MLQFSSKLWRKNHRSGLLPKEHLEVLDGMEVTEFKGYYKVNEYSINGEIFELWPINKTDCIDDISLF